MEDGTAGAISPANFSLSTHSLYMPKMQFVAVCALTAGLCAAVIAAPLNQESPAGFEEVNGVMPIPPDLSVLSVSGSPLFESMSIKRMDPAISFRLPAGVQDQLERESFSDSGVIELQEPAPIVQMTIGMASITALWMWRLRRGSRYGQPPPSTFC